MKKDYGDAYDPNYRKNKWRKGGVPENKNMAPAVPRQKNERGDYVVTSFVIPDRKEAANTGEKVILSSITNEPNYSRLFMSAYYAGVSIKSRVLTFPIERRRGRNQKETSCRSIPNR